MVERIAEIVVLCEDLSQASLVYHALKQKGYTWRAIRVKQGASGQGSGEQYVREMFPRELEYYRNRVTMRSAALVVVSDADTRTLQQRERDLGKALTAAGQAQRRTAEAIALLIPKRNIETWILCLTGERVTEAQDYSKRADISGKIKRAGEGFYEWSRPHYTVPARCVPSLRKGLSEIRRIV